MPAILRPAVPVGFALTLLRISLATAWAESTVYQAGDILVTAPQVVAPLGTMWISPGDDSGSPEADLAGQLPDLPGLAVVRNGPMTGIAQMRGLFNERVKIRVDGMEITPACPNHMDPPLHYATAFETGELEVISGVTPVSLGGDSLAGTIDARSPALDFSTQGTKTKGALMAGHTQGNDARNLAARAEFLGERVSLRYQGSYFSSNDYDYADGTVRNTGVGGSQRHALTLAGQVGGGSLELTAGTHRTRDAGNPSLPMDMIQDDADRLGLVWRTPLGEGSLTARLYRHDIDHLMDNFSLRANSNPLGMHMWAPAESADTGLGLEWARPWAGGGLKLGLDYHGNDFDAYQRRKSDASIQDIINNGERNRLGAYADWWSPLRGNWLYNAGLRVDRVSMDADPVGTFTGAGAPVLVDANAFNTADRGLADTNWDATLLARYRVSSALHLEAGLARKTRSPSLLERYEWTPLNASAGQADGRRYLGNLALEPEVAHTVNLGARYRGRGLEILPAIFYSQVDGFIQGTPYVHPSGTVLRYQNVDAKLYGAEARWRYPISTNVTLDGSLSWVRGENEDNGDNLYRIAPLRGTFNVGYASGPWGLRGEWLLVAGQNDVAAYNGELPSSGYGLINLRAGYRFANGLSLTAGVDNLFDKLYHDHLSGINNVPGVTGYSQLPGPGRSVYLRAAYSW